MHVKCISIEILCSNVQLETVIVTNFKTSGWNLGNFYWLKRKKNKLVLYATLFPITQMINQMWG